MKGELDDTLLASYRAAREKSSPQFMDTVFATLKPYVPFDSARWGTATTSREGVVFHTEHMVNEADCWSHAYREVCSMDTAARYALDRQRTTCNFHFPTFFGRREDAAMLDYSRRVRHASGLLTCHTDAATGLVFYIALFGSDPDRRYSDRQRAFMEAIYPHLMEAWAVNQVLQMERGRNTAITRQWSMAMCTPGGHITLAEPAFFQLLETEWTRARPHYALPSELVGCLKSGAPGYKGRSCVFRFERGAAHALVRVRLACALDQLTDRELTVAKCLFNGMTHKEVARMLGIAPSTVRNHLQAIHRQIGARNNAELVACLKETEL
jgi:DNA-binding CsgD family transcriptional regulator